MRRLLLVLASFAVALGLALPAIHRAVHPAAEIPLPSASASSPSSVPEHTRYPRVHPVILHISHGPGSVWQKLRAAYRSGELKQTPVGDDGHLYQPPCQPSPACLAHPAHPAQ